MVYHHQLIINTTKDPDSSEKFGSSVVIENLKRMIVVKAKEECYVKYTDIKVEVNK